MSAKVGSSARSAKPRASAGRAAGDAGSRKPGGLVQVQVPRTGRREARPEASSVTPGPEGFVTSSLREKPQTSWKGRAPGGRSVRPAFPRHPRPGSYVVQSPPGPVRGRGAPPARTSSLRVMGRSSGRCGAALCTVPASLSGGMGRFAPPRPGRASDGEQISLEPGRR
nr:uncharacterized protein LOC110558272 [Meriones unguiculatus]